MHILHVLTAAVDANWAMAQKKKLIIANFEEYNQHVQAEFIFFSAITCHER